MKHSSDNPQLLQAFPVTCNFIRIQMSQEIKKIFISYSWKPNSNKQKVLTLAERLTNDGIYVILDDWNLKEGQDKYHFMEQMVNDESVDKVLLICNREYTQKANKKEGGVGIESLIISDEIYRQVEQTKFIPIVMEYENNKPCLPTFVNSRIFINLSNDDVYEDEYEKLIRNIYNKPISKRPPIGKMPIHLEDENPLFLPTAHKVSQIKNSLVNGNKNSLTLIKDYIEIFLESLSLFKLHKKDHDITTENFIEKVELSIEQMHPLKNDFIEFVKVIFKYSDDNFEELFLEFFESMLQFYEDNDIRLMPDDYLDYCINDNYRFFNYDLFLSFVSILLKYEKYKTLNIIYKSSFYITKKRNDKPDILNFTEFRKFNYTLNKYKNNQNNTQRLSAVADLIRDKSSIIKFEQMISSDILNYYMSLLYPANSIYADCWIPETSCYNSPYSRLFPKLISKRFFDKIKPLFDVSNTEEYKSKVSKVIEKDSSKRERLQGRHFRVLKIDVGLEVENVGSLD